MTTTETAICCGQCGESKAPSEFARDRQRPNGKNAYCRACRNEWAKANRQRYPDYDHRSRLMRRYGITPEQYDEMLRSQDGRCAICRTDQPGGNGNRTFPVDHDHASGAVRALLCSPCNTAIAFMGEDPARLREAADYLERHDGR